MTSSTTCSGVHRHLIDGGLSEERAYSASWKLLIYTAMFVKVREQMHPSDRAVGDKALETLGVGDNGKGVNAILGWLKKVRKIEAPTVMGTGGGALELADGVKGLLSHASMQAIDNLGSVLADQMKKTPVTVLLDRLDDAWTGEQDSLDLIGGAIRATRDIAITFGQPKPTPVITFLRTDLWERLSFNDKNKMSQDIVYLDWTPEQLLEVIDLRIKTSLERDSAGWDDVFTT